MKRLLFGLLAVTIILSIISIVSATLTPESGIWIFDSESDWNSASVSPILSEVKITGNFVELNFTTKSRNYIWIANYAEHTVSKIDTLLNKEVAVYSTWYYANNNGLCTYNGGNCIYYNELPSRITIDKNGDAWVLNSVGNSPIFKIIADPAECDNMRDGNSALKTSRDDDLPGEAGYGIISGGEIYTFGQDECVVSPVQDFTAGKAVRLAVWLAIAADDLGYVWAIDISNQKYIKVNNAIQKVNELDAGGTSSSSPASAPTDMVNSFVDKSGILWSANLGYHKLTTINTASDTIGPSKLVKSTTGKDLRPYAITGDKYGNIFVSTGDDLTTNPYTKAAVKIDSSGNALLDYNFLDGYGTGITTDKNGNIWVARLLGVESRDYVQKFNGVTGERMCKYDIPTSIVSSDPYGMYTDSKGFIWVSVACRDGCIGGVAIKLDPDDCSRVASVNTGSTPITFTSISGEQIRQLNTDGIWQINLTNTKDDCENNDFKNNIKWTSSNLLAGGNIKIEAKTGTGAFTQLVDNSQFPYNTEFTVKVTITRNSDGTSPKLETLEIYNLTCSSGEANLPPIANITLPLPEENQFEVSYNIQFDASTSRDIDGTLAADGYLWDFGDDQTANTITATHTYNLPASVDDKYYNMNLTVTDNDGAKNTTFKTIHIIIPQPITVVPKVSLLYDADLVNNTAFDILNIRDYPGALYINASKSFVYSGGNGICLAGNCTVNSVKSTGAGVLGYKLLVAGVSPTNGIESEIYRSITGLPFGENHMSLNVTYNLTSVGESSEKVHFTFFLSGCEEGSNVYVDNGSSFETLTSVWCGGGDRNPKTLSDNCCPDNMHCENLTSHPDHRIGCFENCIKERDSCTNVGGLCIDPCTNDPVDNLICKSNNECGNITSCNNYGNKAVCLADPGDISSKDTDSGLNCVNRCSWSGSDTAGECIQHSFCGPCSCDLKIDKTNDSPSQGLATVSRTLIGAIEWHPPFDAASGLYNDAWRTATAQEVGCYSDEWIIGMRGELPFIGILGLIVCVFLLIIFYLRKR